MKLRRRGLSLLEVMLSLTIFGLSMVAIGELIRLGAKSSGEARDLTTAQLYCESIMAEITAGDRLPEPVAEPTPVEVGLEGSDPNWLYSIQLASAEQPSLVSVTVKVERNVEPLTRRTSFTLLRWIPDPGIEFPSSEEESSTTPSTTPSTSGSGTTPAGGASG